MSDIEEEISTVSEPVEVPITKKDPKRVEQGKRLAMISKEAKERKMRERIEKENKENEGYLKYFFPVVSVVSTFGFLWLLLFPRKKEKVGLEPKRVVVEKENPPKKKFEGF